MAAPLPKFFRDALTQVPLTARRGGAAFDDRSVRELRIVARQAVDLLGEGMGHVLVHEGLAQAEIPAPLTADALKAHAGFKAVLGGDVLSPGHADADTVRIAQRALQAVAARVRGTDAALRLSGWGTDGDYGQETMAAVAAWQKAHGLTVDGKLGAEVAAGLVAALTGPPLPDLFKVVTPDERASPAARRIVETARAIVEAPEEAPFTPTVRGKTYRYFGRLFGTEAAFAGRIDIPGNVSYGLRPGTSYWKCNIFAGTVLSVAEVPVSTFQFNPPSPVRHFPRAEKFGPRLAALRGWKMVRALDHRDPDDETQALAGTAQNAEIAELLGLVQPGDLLFVDHPGRPGEDGGHCRVAVEAAAEGDADTAPAFAQASSGSAVIRREGLSRLGGGSELQFWLVRYTG
ncbi:MAG: peptidoglycan-binding domain-containing protein [bacterium]